MAQQIINNLESGLAVRTALNDMFEELYASITPPMRFPGTSANLDVQFNEDTYVSKIFIRQTPSTSGTPNVTIGTTGGGNDIMQATNVNGFIVIDWSDFEAAQDTIYFTISGGTVDITIIAVPNLF